MNTKAIKKKNKIARFIYFVPLIAALIPGCGNLSRPDWQPTDIAHEINSTPSSINPLWIRPEVYTGASWEYLSLGASDGRVFLIGSVNIEESNRLIALDGLTGNLIWKTNPIPPSTLFVNSSGLYLGEAGGGGRITNFEQGSGDVLWSRFFWKSSGIENLLVYENLLYAYLAPDLHYQLSTSTGKNVLFSMSEPPPFFDDSGCGDIYQAPIYTDNMIYFRTGRGYESGEICAMDISTGEILWKSAIDIISNIVVTEGAVFVLVESGDLLVLDPITGDLIPSMGISFDNKPFFLYDFELVIGNYFVAFDEENDILYTYLGDSQQLFAFEIMSDSGR